jgi:hypothetical protein
MDLPERIVLFFVSLTMLTISGSVIGSIERTPYAGYDTVYWVALGITVIGVGGMISVFTPNSKSESDDPNTYRSRPNPQTHFRDSGLGNCPKCDHVVSMSAEKCQNCGHPFDA